ncbi:hypothetical protein PHMEG_0009378 [Phytophthora megakarya]|uniref:Uncharacterized protein n=1 Tax=Phytophthora megakarya TaxID=4795 RepID=A0A225WGF0_9STRA|nr:hypothetical protein PHMEG_0009378 [Phytophthora megakarya]
MVRFRSRRAVKQQAMKEEHRQLEQELKRRVSQLTLIGEVSPKGGVMASVLEREILREENVSLRDKILKHLQLQQTIQTCSATLHQPVWSDVSLKCDMTVHFVKSEWKTVKAQVGAWVTFDNRESPFYFRPFTRQAFESILRRKENKFRGGSSNYCLAKEFLGWEVMHAPTHLRNADHSLLHHVRYSKVLKCSIDEIQDGMRRADGTSEWPILPTAKSLGLSDNITVHTLQQFDNDSRVIVRNFPGHVNSRYLGLVKCNSWEEVNGKRVLKYSFVIADAATNASSHEVEPDHSNIQWVNEGGALLRLVEVDETLVEAEFNYWAICKLEAQAQIHFITFCHNVWRWEQLVTPTRLLPFE